MAVEVRPGFRYTKAQLQEAMTQEVADKLRFKGYYLEVDSEGYYSLVHASKAYGGLGREQGRIEDNRFTGTASFDDPDPIVKRTPEQRLNSLVSKLWPEVKDLGHIPGITDEDIAPIVANLSLRTTRMTGETVRQVAAAYLTRAEAEHEEKLSSQITRHED